MKRVMSKSEPLPEGTVIMADNQYDGRGQAGNTWHTEPGKNLTLSILLHPVFLQPQEQFRLNIAICIAIVRTLKGSCGSGIQVKWPNDIYYQQQKIGGVLIENTLSGNQIKAAVVGIGINVNQLNFHETLGSRVTSLHQITGKAIELAFLVGKLCQEIEASYLRLKSGAVEALYHDYVKDLYLYQEPALYRQNGEIIEGKIIGISAGGLLELETSNGIMQFNFKEIEFFNPSN